MKEIVRNLIIVLGISSFLASPALYAAEDSKTAIDPFDTANAATNPFDISRLTCDGYREMLKEKTPNIFPVVIWMHGVVAGLQGKTVPFSTDQSSGMMILGAQLCNDKHSDKLSDVLLALKKH
jgi:hypothetical protein